MAFVLPGFCSCPVGAFLVFSILGSLGSCWRAINDLQFYHVAGHLEVGSSITTVPLSH